MDNKTNAKNATLLYFTKSNQNIIDYIADFTYSETQKGFVVTITATDIGKVVGKNGDIVKDIASAIQNRLDIKGIVKIERLRIWDT